MFNLILKILNFLFFISFILIFFLDDYSFVLIHRTLFSGNNSFSISKETSNSIDLTDKNMASSSRATQNPPSLESLDAVELG